MLELSSNDCLTLLTADRVIYESYGHTGMMVALTAIFANLNVTCRFLEPAGPGHKDKVVACMLSQFAFVATKIREHFKLRVASVMQASQVEGLRMNEGHRDPWMREWRTLDAKMSHSTAAVNGLRMVDAGSSTRRQVQKVASPAFPAASPGTAPAATTAVVPATALAVVPSLLAEQQAATAAAAAAAAVLAGNFGFMGDSLED